MNSYKVKNMRLAKALMFKPEDAFWHVDEILPLGREFMISLSKGDEMLVEEHDEKSCSRKATRTYVVEAYGSLRATNKCEFLYIPGSHRIARSILLANKSLYYLENQGSARRLNGFLSPNSGTTKPVSDVAVAAFYDKQGLEGVLLWYSPTAGGAEEGKAPVKERLERALGIFGQAVTIETRAYLESTGVKEILEGDFEYGGNSVYSAFEYEDEEARMEAEQIEAELHQSDSPTYIEDYDGWTSSTWRGKPVTTGYANVLEVSTELHSTGRITCDCGIGSKVGPKMEIASDITEAKPIESLSIGCYNIVAEHFGTHEVSPKIVAGVECDYMGEVEYKDSAFMLNKFKSIPRPTPEEIILNRNNSVSVQYETADEKAEKEAKAALKALRPRNIVEFVDKYGSYNGGFNYEVHRETNLLDSSRTKTSKEVKEAGRIQHHRPCVRGARFACKECGKCRITSTSNKWRVVCEWRSLQGKYEDWTPSLEDKGRSTRVATEEFKMFWSRVEEVSSTSKKVVTKVAKTGHKVNARVIKRGDKVLPNERIIPIGSGAYMGNPFKMVGKGNIERDIVCSRFEELFYSEEYPDKRDWLDRLVEDDTSVVLVCNCAPRRCHGDTLKEYLESGTEIVEEKEELGCPQIVCVAGSRKFGRASHIKEVLAKEIGKNDTILSGTASGPDSIAISYGKANGNMVIEMPADWDTYGPSAGPKRNKRMAKYLLREGGRLVAFYDGKSRGTKNMISLCRVAGVPVTIYG